MIRKMSFAVVFCAMFFLIAGYMPVAMAGPDDDVDTVYDYNINWVVQTGVGEITVEAQARYCPACNPNTSGDPNGTYITIYVKDTGGTLLASRKLVLQQPVNFHLNVVCKWQFVFSGLSVLPGQQVAVSADIYCSWCGHWYPPAKTLTIQGSNSSINYTGDLSALVGTSANVSATLVDAGTGSPLAGKIIVFKLNPPAPIATVSTVTNGSGVASTTMPIPLGALGGVYTMDTRFAGDAGYLPTSDQDPFQIIVNRPPIAEANGPYTGNEGSAITFDASGSSDPDGDALQFRWDFDGDGVWDTSWSSSPTAQNTWLDDYTGKVEVEVTDGKLYARDRASVTVLNVAPIADADGPYIGAEAGAVSFIASAIDPGADTLSYDWDMDNDGVFETAGQNPQYTWPDDYNGPVALRVSDDDGGVGYANSSVEVLNVSPMVKPRVIQMRYEAESFFDVFFDFTDVGQKDTHNAVLDWGDGQTGPGIVNEMNGQGTVSGDHTYADNGVYIIVVVVKDDDGGVGKSSLQIAVNNVPPKVEAGPDQTVTAGDLVVLGGSFTDPGWLDTHTASYDFGDGTSGAGVVVEENIPPDSTGTVSGGHTYFAAGEYTVTLTVADKDGGTGKDTLKVVTKAIAATNVKFTPQAVKKNDRNGDPWVMVTGSLPAPYVVKNIDPSTVKLNGVVPAVTNPKYGFTQPLADGSVVFMFKFDRAAVEAILSLGDAIVVTITGKVQYSNGTDTGLADFQGQDVIKVLENKKAAPALTQELVFAALPAYPQPCNPETWIPFKLASDVDVTIKIYSLAGNLVRTLDLGHKSAGSYIAQDKSAYWDGKNETGENVSSGIYFYTIRAGEFTATRKVLIVR